MEGEKWREQLMWTKWPASQFICFGGNNDIGGNLSFAFFLNKSWSEISGSGWVVCKGVLGAITKVFESN